MSIPAPHARFPKSSFDAPRIFRQLLAGALGLAAITSWGKESALIVIDAGHVTGRVPQYVLGQNVEAGDGKGIFPSGTALRSIQSGNGFWNPATNEPVPEMPDRLKAVGTSMLRYPGGCLVHSFDWRQTVGPVEQRPNPEWKFGLDEYLALCRKLGQEPMITVSDYVLPADEMPAHAAELVEYLNAPATDAHPWALKRKAWGHPEPYGVRWFELGNESDHGNHELTPHRVFTPDQYADYAARTARAMKAVDPSIQIGLVMVPGTGDDAGCVWNRTAARVAGAAVDFIILHIYTPHVTQKKSFTPEEEARVLDACMAVPEQWPYRLREYRKMVREESGRELPFAITEYNMGALFNQPKPYRYSLGAALECADLVRVFFQPESRVIAAHYWQFANGYWGMIHSDEANRQFKENPAYPLYRLWGSHFGSALVETSAWTPVRTFDGYPGVFAASGSDFHPAKTNLATLQGAELRPLISADFLQSKEKGLAVSMNEEGVLALDFTDFAKKRYPVIASFARPEGETGACVYSVSYEARFIGERKTVNLALGMVDARGYDQTGSAAKIASSTGAEWQTYFGEFQTLPDFSGVQLLARLEDSGTVTGRLEIRNLVVKISGSPRFPAYPLLTACAALDQPRDPQKLHLMVINKSPSEAIKTTLSLKAFAVKSGKAWEVTGPGLAALEGVRQTLDGVAIPVGKEEFEYEFPPHSMTALELSR